MRRLTKITKRTGERKKKHSPNSHFTFILLDVREFNRPSAEMLWAHVMYWADDILRTRDTAIPFGSIFLLVDSAKDFQTGYQIICTCQRKLTAFSINYVYETIRFYFFNFFFCSLSFRVSGNALCHVLTSRSNEKKYKINAPFVIWFVRMEVGGGHGRCRKFSIAHKHQATHHHRAPFNSSVDRMSNPVFRPRSRFARRFGCLFRALLLLCDFDFIFLHAFSN